jgi:flagellar FliL protein
MKRLVVLLIVVVVLAGGGAAAWFFLLRGDETAEAAEQAPAPVPSFVEFAPLVLPLIQQGQVTQHVTYKIMIEVDRSNEDKVQDSKRQLTDAFIGELHGLLALRYVREMDNSLPFLQDRLLLISDRLLGKGVVERISLLELSKRKPIRG